MIRPLIEFLRPGDTVAEGQEGIHKVDVLEEYPLGLGGELHIGKVPEALHSQGNEPIRQRLGLFQSFYVVFYNQNVKG